VSFRVFRGPSPPRFPGREDFSPLSSISPLSWFLLLLLLAAVGRAEDVGGVRAWLEPKSTHAAVALPIAGAKRTEIAFGIFGADGPELFGKGEDPADAALLAKARDRATVDLVSLTLRYARDRQKVIQYAELTSPKPIVASAVLAPKFRGLFRDTLGETVLVVVPNRYTAYVFPALASRYQEYYPMVFAAFRETAYPVSVEVLEISAAGIRAVGVYERP